MSSSLYGKVCYPSLPSLQAKDIEMLIVGCCRVAVDSRQRNELTEWQRLATWAGRWGTSIEQ